MQSVSGSAWPVLGGCWLLGGFPSFCFLLYERGSWLLPFPGHRGCGGIVSVFIGSAQRWWRHCRGLWDAQWP